MIEKDTIRLLRECDSGIKMGTKAINNVFDHIKSKKLLNLLNACKDRHSELDKELKKLLKSYGDEGKDPNIFLKAMAKAETEMKFHMNKSDKTIASLMVSGCDMGVKSLSMYLNRYKAADEKSKEIAKKLIALEENLSKELRPFL